MPNPQVFTPKYLYDAVRDTGAGMNAGVDPLVIDRRTLAYARNMTMRGTFPTHRPAYVNLPFNYTNRAIQSLVEQGLFQGAEYYKPDFGPEAIILAIGGRLFQVQIVGSTTTVIDVTASGDPQSALAPQVWMWQAEKWMVAQDSVGLPIFFDGNISRRSTGTGHVAATLGAGPYSAPALGATVNVTMTASFSGPFNVLFNVISGSNNIGQMIAVGTGTSFNGYPVTLQNVNDNSTTWGVGVDFDIVSFVATTVSTQLNFTPSQRFSSIVLSVSTAPTVPLGTTVSVFVHSPAFPQAGGYTLTGTLSAYSAGQVTITFGSTQTATAYGDSITVGTQITIPNGSSTLVAKLQQALTVPAVGQTVTAYFDRPYTGSLNQTLYVNGAGGKQYILTAVGTPVASTQVVLQNINVPAATALGNSSLVTQNELPAGKMGTYGLGRVWMALTDGKSFIGGDIVNGSSGTQAYNYRDAVLKTNENSIISGGGSFTVPGQAGDIRALIFSSVLDTSLGQGPLAVITPEVVFTCQAPLDRTTWQSLTSPILTEGMKGGAGLGQWSTVVFNSDIMMRARSGVRSYIQARRDFDVWGNVPVSREVDPILSNDPVSLLQFASAVEFDNRLLLTTTPVQSNFGVYWTQMVALNADPVSSLRGKSPSIYDGVWDGLNVLKLIKGSFAGADRCFAVCVSADLTKIELWEVLKTADTTVYDNAVTPITWEYQSAALNFFENDPRRRDFLRLLDGELRIDKLGKTIFDVPTGGPTDVVFKVYFRADQSPTWTKWSEFTIHYDPNAGDPGYRYAVGLGEPSGNLFDEINNLPLRDGSTFQFKIVVTGHCRINLFRVKGTTVPAVDFAAPVS